MGESLTQQRRVEDEGSLICKLLSAGKKWRGANQLRLDCTGKGSPG
jgi:hypothetical protein